MLGWPIAQRDRLNDCLPSVVFDIVVFRFRE
jgi:hypothetical protein